MGGWWIGEAAIQLMGIGAGGAWGNWGRGEECPIVRCNDKLVPYCCTASSRNRDWTQPDRCEMLPPVGNPPSLSKGPST
jgi:hypothetical protein